MRSISMLTFATLSFVSAMTHASTQLEAVYRNGAECAVSIHSYSTPYSPRDVAICLQFLDRRGVWDSDSNACLAVSKAELAEILNLQPGQQTEFASELPLPNDPSLGESPLFATKLRNGDIELSASGHSSVTTFIGTKSPMKISQTIVILNSLGEPHTASARNYVDGKLVHQRTCSGLRR